jgi:hypothetical protein
VTSQPPAPQDRIDELIHRLAQPWPADDAAELGGELGLAWLELYERDGDEDALRAGVGCLRRTIAGALEHPSRSRWFLGLGLGYGERGRRMRSLPDYHEAMNWLSALYAGGPGESTLRPRALVALGELCWERYWLLRHTEHSDVERSLAEVDRLLGRVGPLLAAPPDAGELAGIRLVAGLAQLERYELTGDPHHLDRGVSLLSVAAIWELPANDLRRCQAGSELVDALRQQSILDGSHGALDRAIAAAQRALESASIADGTAWFLLNRYTASAAYRRWRSWGARSDLDLAFRCWQPLVDLGMDPASAQEYRAMLAARAGNPGSDCPW